MADSLYIPGRTKVAPQPEQEPISPEDGRIAMFALTLTHLVGECDPYFCDGNDAGRFHCFFCGELEGNPHLPKCGHLIAKRLVENGSLDEE
jgi:hypothetical protein